MIHMNEHDIAFAQARFIRATCPNRLALALVVGNLREWADYYSHSDGWTYWQAPRKAAAKAMALIESRTNRENDEQERNDITDAEMREAVRPIKSFLTREKVSPDLREIILRAVNS